MISEKLIQSVMLTNKKPYRILTAVAPYDGHDASVLALNRVLLAGKFPVEVIYLGFNMTGDQICAAAIQENVDAVAVSSYNGGHLHFYPHLANLLRENHAGDVLIFGGGGGTILPKDAQEIEAHGVEKIYGPGWSLEDISEDIIRRIRASRQYEQENSIHETEITSLSDAKSISLLLTKIEEIHHTAQTERIPGRLTKLLEKSQAALSKVIVVTGDGGSGKSTIIDELVRRSLESFPDKKLAILANDPTTSKNDVSTSLLADRVRMNNIYDQRVFMRSVATGTPYAPMNPALMDMVSALRAAHFDLIFVETPGTGQTGINLENINADLTVYVKTKEFGDSFQLEKDQLLLDADIIILNKIDLQGAEAAYQEVLNYLDAHGRKQFLHGLLAKVARDPGMDSLFADICRQLSWPSPGYTIEEKEIFHHAKQVTLVPHRRRAYLADIVDKVNNYDSWVQEQLQLVRKDPSNLSLLDPFCAELITKWPSQWQELSLQAAKTQGVNSEVVTPNGLRLPRVALPDPEDRAESLRFLLEEGLPGMFPFVTGIHPYRTRTSGETTRQFAGLRGPVETNKRLHLLSRDVPKPRLSIAFDGITLYGADSDDDPGSIGKIGEGGVSIDTYEDMKLLLKGFNIADISTSMTINGPAPIILAMYFVAVLEMEQERLIHERGKPLTSAEQDTLRQVTFRNLRGTVQADILKEIQAQNECIFQPEFAIKLLGDVQEWFIANEVRKFYSMSISGYHIGEAGASPIQEMAFTLANGFTYVENFLARNMNINDFAPSLSFFFRVSHEAEWLAYGAVCRKIWAIAMRNVYGAGQRAQMFKFHTQTSGRALQIAEWDTLNSLRLNYHALMALLANTNSLHVDSADEPLTTPGEKWVRQATMIPNYLREEAEGFLIQNLLSGSYAFRTLMKEVQEGVLKEFLRLDQLGGVGPATEQGYQRRCIAENSAKYEKERRRIDGEQSEKIMRKIIGYNAYTLPHDHPDKYPAVTEIIRPEPRDWEKQLKRVKTFRKQHKEDAPEYLKRLRKVALGGGNIFAELLHTVKHATLGQITRTLSEAGGRYRKMV